MEQLEDVKQVLNRLKLILDKADKSDGLKLEELRNVLMGFDASRIESIKAVPVQELFKAVAREAVLLSGKKSIPVNIGKYDAYFGGLWPGEFAVIGARPAMGKSLLLMQMALNVAKNQEVLFFSFDMTAPRLMDIMIRNLVSHRIDFSKDSAWDDANKEYLAKAEQLVADLKLHVIDHVPSGISAFKALCKKHVEEKGVKAIFVDYLQLLVSNRYRGSREVEVSHISRELKNIARELDVCVVVTSQLSRSVETRGGDKRPILSDLRESGAIEQDADKVMFLYRPEYYGLVMDEMGQSTVGLAEVLMVKNRNGACDVLHLEADFRNYTYREREEPKTDFDIDPNRLNDLDDPDLVPF